MNMFLVDVIVTMLFCDVVYIIHIDMISCKSQILNSHIYIHIYYVMGMIDFQDTKLQLYASTH